VADIAEQIAALPDVALAPGDVLCAEGDAGGAIWFLESGSLRVLKAGVQVNTIATPGAVVGEMAVLLGVSSSATVVADEPTRLRVAADGAALLRHEPAITAHVAAVLAERLSFVTTYLADLKHQYGDAPGLAMVSDVLKELAAHQGPAARPGSARDPDPEY
jgi:CRP-like cAMP-binding protein